MADVNIVEDDSRVLCQLDDLSPILQYISFVCVNLKTAISARRRKAGGWHPKDKRRITDHLILANKMRSDSFFRRFYFRQSFLNMLSREQDLPVQVGYIDGIVIPQSHLGDAKSCQTKGNTAT